MSPSTEALSTLQSVLDLLTDPASGCAVQPPACRVALYPGDEVPFDTCELSPSGANGQLYASLQAVNLADDTQVSTACHGTYTFTALVGITRCAAKPGDDGTMPPVDVVEGDAWQQAADADAIRAAFYCCPGRSETITDLVLQSWTPTVGGGCVGGYWTVQGAYHDCCN